MLFIVTQAYAVTGRHPTGVNVNTNGVSTVLITFHNLEQEERAVDAFWCGEVTNSGVVVGTNPCVPGTLLGHLPRQFDFATRGQAGIFNNNCSVPLINGVCPTDKSRHSKSTKNRAGSNNLTDVMTIPTAVIRRAYQEAQRGKSSEFFYVRQFVNNGISTYVTVTCRMAGGGARTPLSLTNVDLNFDGEGFRQSVTLVKQNAQLPKLSAKIQFNGSGLLKGRWEIVRPGDVEPSRFDLLSEASLSAEDRPLQKRYRLISRFQKFLAPNGSTIIPGPDPRLLPTLEKGLYRILLRIEASNDKEGNSDTLAGILNTGGVAGFPMPTLRYFVGEREQLKKAKNHPPISLLLPHSKQTLSAKQINFTWFDLQDSSDVAIYKIEFYEIDGDKKLIASALKKPGESSYNPAKTLLNKLNKPFLWRVIAIDKDGMVLSSSQLRRLTINQL
jgi:hypothetical protein